MKKWSFEWKAQLALKEVKLRNTNSQKKRLHEEEKHVSKKDGKYTRA